MSSKRNWETELECELFKKKKIRLGFIELYASTESCWEIVACSRAFLVYH